MDLSQVLLLVLSSIGVINALMLSIYFLFIIKPKELHNYFLGTFLLLLSIRIGKSVIYYFIPATTGMHIYLQVGLSAWFLIGPFLYIYIYYFLTTTPNKHVWMYNLGMNLVLLGIFSYLYPYTGNSRMWHLHGINITFIQIFMYLVLAGFVLKKTIGLIPKKGSPWKSKESWTWCIFWGTFSVWLAYFLTGLTSYIFGAITFSFMLYLLIYLLLMSTSDRSAILFKNIQKYGGRTIAADDAKNTLQRLENALNIEEMFRNPDLKIKELADHINVSPAQLSQIINEQLDKSFSQLIIEHRIAKAKTMILENEQFTLEGIGYECGFKAKTTFFATFKKEVGKTPAQFKKGTSI